MVTRRKLLQSGLYFAAATAMGFSLPARAASKRVVIVGGGFGGATAAQYLKRLDQGIEVTLIEPEPVYYTCPFSNTVIGARHGLHSPELRWLGEKRCE